jgi:hypothetical protein
MTSRFARTSNPPSGLRPCSAPTAHPPSRFTSEIALDGVLTVEIGDGRITRLYAIANPEKVATFAVPRMISRVVPPLTPSRPENETAGNERD